nr:transposase [Endozoicomonas sp.]
MTFPFDISSDPKDDLVRKLLEYTTNLEKKNTLLFEDNGCLREDNGCLREDNTCLLEDNTRLNVRVTALENEIHRLKGLNCKPDIKPNTKPPEPPSDDQPTDDDSDPSGSVQPTDDDPDTTGDDQPTGDDSGSTDDGNTTAKNDEEKGDTGKPDERTQKKRKKPPKPPVTNSARRPPVNIPEGSTFKGITPYNVQELSFSASVTRYELEHWITPDGSFISGQLPESVQGSHFGPEFRGYILHQHHACAVTEPMLLESLWDMGASISSGQLSNLLTKNHDAFHAEKDELLAEGLLHCDYLQTDDTGARHQGQNGYCTVIGNSLFTWFGSTQSKSRENFLTLLHRPWKIFVLNGHAMSYLVDHDFPVKWQKKFKGCLGVHFFNRKAWDGFLNDCGMEGPDLRRRASEAMLYGSLVAHGVPSDLPLHSDGAGQFDVFTRSGCWLHAARPLDRVIPVNSEQVEEQHQLLCRFWQLYRELKDFKEKPEAHKADAIRKGFSELVQTRAECSELRGALGKLAVKETELLEVLDDPNLPLHNNLSESQIREYVKRRKISGGTRSEAGRQSRDTFASLKKTCRLHGISFWEYLKDRLNGIGLIPRLSSLIMQPAGDSLDDSFASGF